MHTMKHALITCADANHGDFLYQHWLASLIENVDISGIDIIVIDYGLTLIQKSALDSHGVIRFEATLDGFPNSIKFRDILQFFTSRDMVYDQVLTCDGGDIIFQNDIRPVFEEHRDKFRVVLERNSFPFEYIVGAKGFNRSIQKTIRNTLKNKPLINCGILFSPYKRFIHLCKECLALMKIKSYGPDQLAVNYILYREGFMALPEVYNFMINQHNPSSFYVKEGVFHRKDHSIIPIVHNVGGKRAFRAVKNFGYGKDRNQIDFLIHRTTSTFIRATSTIREKSLKRYSEIYM